MMPPGKHAALRHGENTLHRFPVQQLEVGSVFHIKAGGTGHDPIEKSGTFFCEKEFLFPGFS